LTDRPYSPEPRNCAWVVLPSTWTAFAAIRENNLSTSDWAMPFCLVRYSERVMYHSNARGSTIVTPLNRLSARSVKDFGGSFTTLEFHETVKTFSRLATQPSCGASSTRPSTAGPS